MNWKDLLKWGLVGLIFVFLFRFLYNSWGDVQNYEFELNWWLFIFSYVFLFLHFVLISVGWDLLLKVLNGKKLPIMKALRIRVLSDFGRFVPGKVWLILGRINYCKKWGISSDVVTYSSLMEIFIGQISAVILFMLVFLLYSHQLTSYALIILVFLPAMLTLLHPELFNTFMKFASKLFKKKFVRTNIKFSFMLSLISVFILAWVMMGIGFFLMANAVYPIGLDLLFPFIAVYSISWVLGFVMIFLPAGLGFREAVMTFLLSFFVPVPIAILLAVLSRLWAISGEMLAAGLLYKV